MQVDLDQLPIPDWGLLCPNCRYPLKGLPSHRCPECGRNFDIRRLVRPWTRLRAPRFTGKELPLPDFGLVCRACGTALAGATRHQCPTCAEPFDPLALQPATEWFVLDARACAPLHILVVQDLLTSEQIPYIPADEASLRELLAGRSLFQNRLRVSSEFFFEVLWLLAAARRELYTARRRRAAGEWHCPYCRQANPGHFEICWNCGKSPEPQAPRRES